MPAKGDLSNQVNNTPRATAKRKLCSPEEEKKRIKKSFFETMAGQDRSVASLSCGELMNMIERTMEKKLDERMGALATKEDVEVIRASISLNMEMNEKLKKELEDVKKDYQDLKISYQELKANMEFTQNELRKNNLIFRGVVVIEGSSPKEAIHDLCSRALGVQDVQILRCFTLGRATADQNAPILAEFDQKTINGIFSNMKKLKGTSVVIHRDVTPATRRATSRLLYIRKQCLELKPQSKIKVKGYQMDVDGTKFRWCSSRGLIRGEENGTAVLSALMQQDMEEIVKKAEEFTSRKTVHPPGNPSSNI